MGLTAIDIIVLLVLGGAAVMGFLRGFVSEVLSLLAYVLIIFAVRLFHTPLTEVLTDMVGTLQGAAVLAFAILAGGTYFAGRVLARMLGSRTRNSILGPLDRVLGLGFGLTKGLIVVSLGFLVLVLVIDTMRGGPAQRPDWITLSRTYPLLDATSSSIAEFVDRRRRGEPVFGVEEGAPTPTPEQAAP